MNHFDIGIIVLFLINFITNLINIPYKIIHYCEAAIQSFKTMIIALFNEIKHTGELTIQFKIIRSLHNDKIEKQTPTEECNLQPNARVI